MNVSYSSKTYLSIALSVILFTSVLYMTGIAYQYVDAAKKSSADSEKKSSADSEKKSSADSEKKSTVDDIPAYVPTVKLIHKGNSYNMLPFVVMDDQDIKKLNFPQLPDDVDPSTWIPISSSDTISFEYSQKPRETSAFVIDYDADANEISPMKRISEDSFGFSDVYGPRNLEVRVIYPDGKYVTYTTMINITNDSDDISQSYLNNGSSNDDIKQYENSSEYDDLPQYDNNAKSNNHDFIKNYDEQNSNFDTEAGSKMTVEQRILKEYGNMIGMENVPQDNTNVRYEHSAVENGVDDVPSADDNVEESNIKNISFPENNKCLLNEIPANVVTNKNNVGSDSNFSDSTPSVRVDVGEAKQICAVKVSFSKGQEIKFFTMSFSNDGKDYTSPEYYTSSANGISAEIYKLKDAPVVARYIKLNELGKAGSDDGWISNIRVLGNNGPS